VYYARRWMILKAPNSSRYRSTFSAEVSRQFICIESSDGASCYQKAGEEEEQFCD